MDGTRRTRAKLAQTVMFYHIGSPIFSRLIKENLEKYEDSKRIFLSDGKYYEEGELFKQPDLAETLARMQKDGAKGFYTGKTAQTDRRRYESEQRLDHARRFEKLCRQRTRPVERDLSRPRHYFDAAAVIRRNRFAAGFAYARKLRRPDDGLQFVGKIHLLAEACAARFADRAEYMG